MSELCDSVGTEFSAESAIQCRIWGPLQNFFKIDEIEQKMLCIFLIFSSFYGMEWACLYNHAASVICPSVRLSVRLSGQNCFSDANGRIITNLAHSGYAGQSASTRSWSRS